MNYIIRPILPEIREILTIDEAEYTEITRTLKLAWDILLVKELFSYVVRNYNHLEIEIQKIESEANNDSKLFDKLHNGSFRLDNTHICNLLMMNLLTTCKSYLDAFYYQNQNKDKEIFVREDDIRKKLEGIVNQYYKKNIIYTLFGELRNYAQHHSSPIEGSSTKINKLVKIGMTVNIYKILKQLDNCQKLRKYLKAKSSNYSQQELNTYPKELNIRPLLKEYILLIIKIDEEFNSLLNSEFQVAKNVIRQKVEHYCQDNSPESAFEIYKLTENSQKSDERFDVSLQLITDWEKTIEKYSRINQINDQFNLS